MAPRHSCWLAVAAICGTLLPGLAVEAQTYGYRREDDPLVENVKEAVAAGRAKDEAALRRALVALAPSVSEVRERLGIDLDPALRAAADARDPETLAYQLTHLVFQALRMKLHINLEERLANPVPARARLDAAQYYYEAILSHAVRRADRATKSTRHANVLELLRTLRGTLGSPGLFGVGEKPADPDAFARLAAQLETHLRAVYSDFTGATPTPPAPPTAPVPAPAAPGAPGTPDQREDGAGVRVEAPRRGPAHPPVDEHHEPAVATLPALAQAPDNPFFDPADLAKSPLERLPFELHGRADLTLGVLGDKRNLDDYDKFFVNTLNPALHVRYQAAPHLALLAEIELDGHKGVLELDQLLAEVEVPALQSHVGLGVTYVPFGIERHFYSSATNPLVDRPSPFRRIFPGSYSDLGVFLRGRWVDAATGRGLAPELAVTRGLRGPDRDDRPDDLLDTNDELQFAGRLGVPLVAGWEVGASGLLVWFDDQSTHHRLELYGLDLLWRGDFHHLRAEWVGGTVGQDDADGGDFRRSGWYVELYRRFPIDRPWLKAMEVVTRVDSIDPDSRVRDFLDVERYALGVNWVPHNHVRLKVEVQHANERSREISNDALFVQWEVHF